MRRRLSKSGPRDRPKRPAAKPNMRMRPTRPTDQLAATMKGIDVEPYTEPIDEIVRALSLLSQARRQKLLRRLQAGLMGRSLSRIEGLRVAACKLIVSLLPDSVRAIEELLFDFSDSDSYEIHFSLFCFLNYCPDIRGAEEFSRGLPNLIGEYLRNVKSTTASAAWMAGDLMGEDWVVAEAVPILTDACRNGRYVAGRLGALHGLEHTLNRIDIESVLAANVASAVSAAARSDRSSAVRYGAGLILHGNGPCGKHGPLSTKKWRETIHAQRNGGKSKS